MVEAIINAWVERNSLKLFTKQGDRDIRCVYLSSLAGECYQIWINGFECHQLEVHAACVEGRRDTEEEPLQTWHTTISELDFTLEQALGVVLELMKPSVRFYPSTK